MSAVSALLPLFPPLICLVPVVHMTPVWKTRGDPRPDNGWTMASPRGVGLGRLTLLTTALWQVRWAMVSPGPIPSIIALHILVSVSTHFCCQLVQARHQPLHVLQEVLGVSRCRTCHHGLVAWGSEPNGWLYHGFATGCWYRCHGGCGMYHCGAGCPFCACFSVCWSFSAMLSTSFAQFQQLLCLL